MIDPAFSIDGKKILITGASSGIGYETAIKCAAAGANLLLIGRNKEKLETLLSALPTNDHSFLVADLTDAGDINSIVEKAGKLDGLVYSAGIVSLFPAQFLTRSKLDQSFAVNYYGAVELVSLLLKKKKMNEAASLVFLSSIASTHSFKGGTAYAGSKAALEAFCRSVAIEFSAKKIRANCLAPAMVKTPIFDDMEKGLDAESVKAHLEKYPLGVGYPQDIANAIIFLLSGASRWITGITIRMDGGLLLES